MALSAAPTFTPGSAGNVVAASTTVTNGTAVTETFAIGLSGDSGRPGHDNDRLGDRRAPAKLGHGHQRVMACAVCSRRRGRIWDKPQIFQTGPKSQRKGPREITRRCALGKAGRRSAPCLITRRSRSPPADLSARDSRAPC